MRGTQELVCKMTGRDGAVVWDSYGITRPDWNKLGDYRKQGFRWDLTFGPGLVEGNDPREPNNVVPGVGLEPTLSLRKKGFVRSHRLRRF